MFLRWSEPCELHRSDLQRERMISRCSSLLLLIWISLKCSERADSSDRDFCSLASCRWERLRSLRIILTLATLLSCRREDSSLLRLRSASWRRRDSSRCCSISCRSCRFSRSRWFSWILRSSFAFICFSSSETSNCCRRSFSSCALASNSRRFRSVNFSRSKAVCGAWAVAGKTSFSELGSCCCRPSSRCESLADRHSLLGNCKATALALSRHSGLSRTWARTSRIASSKFWLQISILQGILRFARRSSLVPDRLACSLAQRLDPAGSFSIINFIIAILIAGNLDRRRPNNQQLRIFFPSRRRSYHHRRLLPPFKFCTHHCFILSSPL